MSTTELLVIALVAVLVFGPNKLPMLATHLGLFFKKINQLKTQASQFWIDQLNQQQLKENEDKARQADEQYKK